MNGDNAAATLMEVNRTMKELVSEVRLLREAANALVAELARHPGSVVTALPAKDG